MDLIYANNKGEDVGVLLAYELDVSFGASENDFELKVSNQRHCCDAGFIIYVQGTEYGGVIDAVTSDTANGEVTYSGRTWHGILNSKILLPDTGSDYLTLQGEANAVLSSLVQRCGLGDLFAVNTEDSGITIPGYTMDLYIPAYSGIRKMLQSVGAKLTLQHDGSHVVLSAAPIVDYTQSGVDADVMDFTAKRTQGKANHLICLGKGELKDRLTVHLYADQDGHISQTQSQFGVNEYATTYEYSSVEDAEELAADGTERFKELLAQDELNVTMNDTSNLYDIGDVVGATDNTTGISVAVTIAQKIVTIKDGVTEVSYSTEITNTAASYSSGGSSSGGDTSTGLTVYTKTYSSSSFWCDANASVTLSSYTPDTSGTYLVIFNLMFSNTVTGRTFVQFGGRRVSLPANTPYPYDDVISVTDLTAGTAYPLTFWTDTAATYTYESITIQSIKLT